MVVALTPDQEESCRGAIVPVEIVRASTVRDACVSMSSVLPLLVVVDAAISDADRSSLSEMTTACGAEIVTIESGSDATGKAFATRLLDALRVAELRRLGAPT
jgi:hypothetical protein